MKVAASIRRHLSDKRTTVILLLALSPLVLGSYRNACNRSVGVWPDYFVPSPRISLTNAQSHASAAHVTHVFAFVHWDPRYYSCTPASPPTKTCLAAGTPGHTKVFDDVYNLVKPWASKTGAQYDVNIILDIFQQQRNPQIGPTQVQGDVITNLERFYDEVYKVMSLPDFNDASLGHATWLISLGNEVDNFLATDTDWQRYAFIAATLNIYIKGPTGNPQGLPIVTGVTETYYGGPLPHQTDSNSWQVRAHSIGDVVNITYYPFVDCDRLPSACPITHGGLRMAEPGQVTIDFQVMSTYLNTVNAYRSSIGAASAYVFLQEVGYPSETSWHTGCSPGHQTGCDLFCPDSAGAACNPGTDTATLENYQAQFVDQLFSAFNANSTWLRGMTWWSLYDYTPYSSHGCSPFWPAGDEKMCYMGLRRSNGTAKPAFSRFADQAQQVQ